MDFGWAPVGQRLLNEYSQETERIAPSTFSGRFAKTWTEVKELKVMKGGAMVALAVDHMRLLHAVDTFPRGGLCQGAALKEAIRRYERMWLPLIAAQQASAAVAGTQGYSHLVPPLDVAFMWHLHRLQPAAYQQDCAQLKGSDGRPLAAPLHVTAQQAFAFTDGSDQAGAATAALWRQAYPSEPFYPPPNPGSQTDTFRSYLSADLAAVAVRMPVFLHQLLRSCYNKLPFLNRAVDRYAKFLLLVKHHLELQHPIPPLDIALMWASHMSASGAYAADCQQLLQRQLLDMPGAGASLWLERDMTGPWRFHFTDTQRAWLDEFEEPFVVPGSGYVPLDSPHPAEQRCSTQLLACFEEQPAAAGAAAGAKKVADAWRAGAHALYLAFLRNPNLLQQIQQQMLEEQAARNPAPAAPPPPVAVPLQTPVPAAAKKKKGGLFACFGCGGADADDDSSYARQQQHLQEQQQQQLQQQAVAAAPAKPQQLPLLNDAELRKVAAGFSSFKNLPHSSKHPYWRMLSPRVGDEAASDGSPAQLGAEVELFAAAAPAGPTNGSYMGRDVGVSDQEAVTGDYEVQVAGGQPLMW